MKDNVFLILGGDERMLYLGEYLEKNGLQVCYYAFSDTDCFSSLKEAMDKAKFIILPLPFTRDRVTLNAPLFEDKVQISDICALATKENVFFGGQLPNSFTDELFSVEAEFYDYFLFEELAVYNAVPTAEGVVEVLTNNLPITIHNMNCAVLGYGKVGKVLASTLHALGANVTVFARSETAFADAYSKSIFYAPFSELKEKEQSFDAVINTVPAKVLGREEMENLPSGCLLVEIASAPFGIDFQAAKEFALTVIKANSLPGKTAPKTSGEIIGCVVLPILKKRGFIT